MGCWKIPKLNSLNACDKPVVEGSSRLPPTMFARQALLLVEASKQNLSGFILRKMIVFILQ